MKACEVEMGKGHQNWASPCPAASYPRFTQPPHSLKDGVTFLNLQMMELRLQAVDQVAQNGHIL